MASLAEVQAYGATVDGLSTLAIADLNKLLRPLAGQPAPYVRDALLAQMGPLVEPYGLAVGEVSAEYYTTLRASSGLTTPYRSVVGVLPEQARIDSLVRWGVTPMFEKSATSMLALLAGGMQRMIAGVGRDTVRGNAARETDSLGVQIGTRRVPSAGCCAFCAMVSLNTYGSDEAAGGVVGRGKAVGTSRVLAGGKNRGGGAAKGVRPRGKQSLGSLYHDFCRCSIEPVWSESDSEFAQSARFQEYEDAYGDAYAEGNNTKEYLAAMRQILGSR